MKKTIEVTKSDLQGALNNAVLRRAVYHRWRQIKRPTMPRVADTFINPKTKKEEHERT